MIVVLLRVRNFQAGIANQMPVCSTDIFWEKKKKKGSKTKVQVAFTTLEVVKELFHQSLQPHSKPARLVGMLKAIYVQILQRRKLLRGAEV